MTGPPCRSRLGHKVSLRPCSGGPPLRRLETPRHVEAGAGRRLLCNGRYADEHYGHGEGPTAMATTTTAAAAVPATGGETEAGADGRSRPAKRQNCSDTLAVLTPPAKRQSPMRHCRSADGGERATASRGLRGWGRTSPSVTQVQHVAGVSRDRCVQLARVCIGSTGMRGLDFRLPSVSLSCFVSLKFKMLKPPPPTFAYVCVGSVWLWTGGSICIVLIFSVVVLSLEPYVSVQAAYGSTSRVTLSQEPGADRWRIRREWVDAGLMSCAFPARHVCLRLEPDGQSQSCTRRSSPARAKSWVCQPACLLGLHPSWLRFRTVSARWETSAGFLWDLGAGGGSYVFTSLMSRRLTAPLEGTG